MNECLIVQKKYQCQSQFEKSKIEKKKSKNEMNQNRCQTTASFEKNWMSSSKMCWTKILTFWKNEKWIFEMCWMHDSKISIDFENEMCDVKMRLTHDWKTFWMCDMKNDECFRCRFVKMISYRKYQTIFEIQLESKEMKLCACFC